jgi:UDP-N-acetylmuramoyl-tripeptide--D-alanyl-D-alanine ligase
MTLLAVAVACLVCSGVAQLRWLRVAQREHYIAWSVGATNRRWARLGPNRLLLGALLVSLFASLITPWAALIAAAGVVVYPFGLGLRGRTSRLAWTARMKRLALIDGVILVVLFAIVLVSGRAAAAAAFTLVALDVADYALLVANPIERRLSQKYVDQATKKLQAVRPTIVAITGSYGKTTTKGYLAYLVGGARPTVATPRSFNNTMGLARAINEHLAPGTEVFIAEMGTYGPGEIAELCSWCPPDIAVITAIGPVHLERMKSTDGVLEAKAEITEGAATVILNVDDPLLRRLADRLRAERPEKKVVRASASLTVSPDADLCIEAETANVACAAAAALELGVPRPVIDGRLATLPVAEHRLSVGTSDKGFSIIDDTFNSNPAGAALALRRLGEVAGSAGRAVVVTPGMIELGPLQFQENERFAAEAARTAGDLLIVGYTNRAALAAGARGGTAIVQFVDTREQAVDWVRQHLGPGDAVLYENDLPDHYP